MASKIKNKGLKFSRKPFEKTSAIRKGHILAVAIDEYTQCPPLNNCVRDSEAFLKLLTTHFQFEEKNITRLYNRDANQEKIIKTIRDFAERLTNTDNLLILYSGHGIFDDILEEGYWIPVDAKLGNNGDFISNAEIIKFIKAIKTHHTALIVDSCFSGTLAEYKSIGIQRLEKYPSRWLLTSGRKEVVSDGPPGENSPFIKWILKFLELHKNDRVLFSELVQYVKIAVGNNVDQIPAGNPMHGVGDEGGEFIFYAKNFILNKKDVEIIEKEINPISHEPLPVEIDPNIKRPAFRRKWLKQKKTIVFGSAIITVILILIINFSTKKEPEYIPDATISRYTSHGKIGYRKGNTDITKAIFEDGYDFTEGFGAVRKEGKYGYIDTTGNLAIPYEFEDAGQFFSGLAPVKKNGLYGFINTQGEKVIAFEYVEAQPFMEGTACVKRDSLYIYIDNNGNQLFGEAYDKASSFIKGSAYVEINGEQFKMDRKGNKTKQSPKN